MTLLSITGLGWPEAFVIVVLIVAMVLIIAWMLGEL